MLQDEKMEPEDGWVELDELRYKVYEFYDKMHNDFKIVDLLNYNVAVAQNGGPIAVARNLEDKIFIKTQHNDPLKDHICFFANNG